MYQTDLEDLIDEYNLAHGLPPAKRNPPRPIAAPILLPVMARRPRRPRTPRMMQTNLEDFIAADKAAEAAGTAGHGRH